MTGRERLTAILEGRPADRVPWTTLVDPITRSVMPAEIRDMPILDFYRHIGCDFAAFGNYGLPPELQVKSPCRLVQPDVEEKWETLPGNRAVKTTRTPWGTLAATFQKWHPTRHPVETIQDLRVLKNIWLHSRYEETGPEAEESCRRLDAAIGDSGVSAFTFDPSPMQTLLEFDMGLVNAYALLADHPQEFEELLAVMHSRRMQEYEICARRMPCRVFIPVENTSTTMISPAFYEKYSLPHVRALADTVHRHGKLMILHMCGLLRDLLPLIKQTGADGINALCPAPIGNTAYEHALDVLGEDLIIWGGILDDNMFHGPSFSREKLEAALAKILTPRVRASRFLLWIPADGLETPVERFLMVRDWMEKNGRQDR